MIVLKFGGTSVGTSSALEQVKNIVMAHQEPVIVVVSALGGMTDQLVELMQMDSRSSKVTEMLDAFGCRYANLISAMIDESIQPQVRTDINRLLRELQKDIGNAPRDTYFQDKIISYGERLSSVFVSRLFGAKTPCWYRSWIWCRHLQTTAVWTGTSLLAESMTISVTMMLTYT